LWRNFETDLRTFFKFKKSKSSLSSKKKFFKFKNFNFFLEKKFFKFKKISLSSTFYFFLSLKKLKKVEYKEKKILNIKNF